jgi:trans-aconitate methyltransferase
VPDKLLQGVYGPMREMPVIDASVAHCARVYDYLLGGRDNFAADRAAGEQMIAALPNVVTSSRMNRAFLARAVRFLAAECGVRQFLDIGTGIPSPGNTHEAAQQIAPQARVVYIDNDPIVLAHARAQLTSTPEGAVSHLDADLRQPDDIVRAAAAMLDFHRPIALMMLLVLHMIPSAAKPDQIVARLTGALPGGSYLALSHPASDIQPEAMARMTRWLNAMLAPGTSMTARSHEVARFFNGMDILPPGLVQVHRWRPEDDADPDVQATIWCGVARKG